MPSLISNSLSLPLYVYIYLYIYNTPVVPLTAAPRKMAMFSGQTTYKSYLFILKDQRISGHLSPISYEGEGAIPDWLEKSFQHSHFLVLLKKWVLENASVLFQMS